jgi:hypothetical protein
MTAQLSRPTDVRIPSGRGEEIDARMFLPDGPGPHPVVVMAMAPVGPALSVAARAPRGELYRSRGGHYDVYAGGVDHENVLRVELEFLRRHAAVY